MLGNEGSEERREARLVNDKAKRRFEEKEGGKDARRRKRNGGKEGGNF